MTSMGQQGEASVGRRWWTAALCSAVVHGALFLAFALLWEREPSVVAGQGDLHVTQVLASELAGPPLTADLATVTALPSSDATPLEALPVEEAQAELEEAVDEAVEEVAEAPDEEVADDSPPDAERETMPSVAQPAWESEPPEVASYLSDVDHSTAEETQAEFAGDSVLRAEMLGEPHPEEEAAPDTALAGVDDQGLAALEVDAPGEELGEDAQSEAFAEPVEEAPSSVEHRQELLPEMLGAEADERLAEAEGPARGADTPAEPSMEGDDLVGLFAREVRAPGEHSVAREAARVDHRAYADAFGAREAADRARLEMFERRALYLGDVEEEGRLFAEALMNFDVNARPGRETRLNTQRDAFAAYIHHIHDKIHRHWPSYLQRLDVTYGVDHPLSDPSLVARVEMVLSREGEVTAARIARTSGQLLFDAEAVATVLRVGPHRPPPAALLSHDGKAYIQWGFHRDQRQCGTFGVTLHWLEPPERDEPG